ncbi:hypothetical protein HYC85_029458 [Camellia sinensis]|uniref:Uncharacterized protein n=1 Tax=Camellia sinensis TaxID=4442 RepID=A0A7J7FYP8_CAMSI|nr:hypothetical protein HYC85_029458 [Camellia sinensis]
MPCEASPHITGHGLRPPASDFMPSAMYIAGRHSLLPVATLYLAKQSMFGTSFQKSVSQNDLPDLDSLVQIKNRDTNRVRTVVRPHASAPTVSGDSAGDLESLTRTHDILF